jgi:hypothetical protein
MVAGALLAAVMVCAGHSQTLELPGLPAAGAQTPPAGVPPAPPKEPAVEVKTDQSIDALLARLDAIKVQQEELDKAKKETVTLLKEKLKQQKQRLQKLGASVEEESPRAPLSTGAAVGPALNKAVGASRLPAPLGDVPVPDQNKR